MTACTQISHLARRGILLLLPALVLIVPLLASPNLSAWRGVKPITFELLVLALLTLLLVQGSASGSRPRALQFLGIGVHQPVLMLVLYGAASWFRSPAPGLSATEWWRWACGAGLYFVVVSAVRREAQIRTVVMSLIAAVILTSVIGLAGFGQPDHSSISATFGNGQLFSGFLLILLPLLMVLAFNEESGSYKIAAQAAVLLALAGLVLAQTRSSWLGSLVAMAALGWMALRYPARGQRFAQNRHRLVVPLTIVVGALGLLLIESHTAPLLAARATTLAHAGKDPSLAWREEMWKGAWKLTRERPLFGWGIGTFPLEQAHVGSSAPSSCLAGGTGPNLGVEAHNEYLQIGAEMGVIGLGLYLWVLGAFFVTGIRALPRCEPGLRKLVLMGCLAGVAGQVVDALSNPAWRFADVSFVFWLMLGLGVAVARISRRVAVDAPPDSPVEPRPASARLTWQAAVLGIGVLAIGGAWASTVPANCPQALYPNANFDLRLLATISQGRGTVTTVGNSVSVKLCPGACVTFQLQYKMHNTSDSFQDVPLQCAVYSAGKGDKCLSTTPQQNVICNTCSSSDNAKECSKNPQPLTIDAKLKNGPTDVTAPVAIQCSGC